MLNRGSIHRCGHRRRYWDLVQAAAYDCTAEVADLAALTSRQRQIVALLSADAHDEAIARTLGISVRTVRSDIANLMDILGVKSRFAAGQRLTRAAQHVAQRTDPPLSEEDASGADRVPRLAQELRWRA